MAPTVSVLIPNHNYGRFVAQAIESALAQTYPPMEVIVVDNGSTDDSREVLSRITDPRVKVVHQQNLGQSGARNALLRKAGGDLLAFLDADDVWLPGKLAKQVPLFLNESVGLVYCGLRKVSGNLGTLENAEMKPVFRGNVLSSFALQAGAVVCGGESSAIVRASIARVAGEFDGQLSIAAGWDYWRRIASRAQVDFVDESLVLYRQHGANLSRRLDLYARDSELKLGKMFEDPASSSVHELKRRAYGTHRMAIAGAFIQNWQPWQALYWGVRAFFTDPGSLVHAAGWPYRFLKRRLA